MSSHDGVVVVDATVVVVQSPIWRYRSVADVVSPVMHFINDDDLESCEWVVGCGRICGRVSYTPYVDLFTYAYGERERAIHVIWVVHST